LISIQIQSIFEPYLDRGEIVKEVQISGGIVPLGEFKSQAAKLLRKLGESGEPVVITQNGRPAGVLLSPIEFDRIQVLQRFLESIAAGLGDAEAGRVMDTAQLRSRLRALRAQRKRK
jgi:prevent-host-death family protein